MQASNTLENFSLNNTIVIFDRIRENKTTIIIAHRISTLETLDKIIVVNNGSIDAIGNHNELLKTCKIYQHEVHLQELEKELEG